MTVIASGLKTPRWVVAAPDGSIYVSAHRLEGADGPDASEGRVIVLIPTTGAPRVVATDIRHLEGLQYLDGVVVAATRGLQGGQESAGALLRYAVLNDGSLGAAQLWIDTGLKQPMALGVDTLSSVYVSSKELVPPIDGAKRAIGKAHPDGRLTGFAASLEDPQGLAFAANGALYAATANRVAC